jgi:hypothetical protein
MSRKINHNWNSDIRIKDHYGATNGFVSSYLDGLGRGETCVFGVISLLRLSILSFLRFPHIPVPLSLHPGSIAQV